MRGLSGVLLSLFVVACSHSSATTPDGGGGSGGDMAASGGGGGTGGGDMAGVTTPLSMLPDTSAKIVPFADQLNNGYSDALVRFVATHYAGTQKMLKAENNNLMETEKELRVKKKKLISRIGVGKARANICTVMRIIKCSEVCAVVLPLTSELIL